MALGIASAFQQFFSAEIIQLDAGLLQSPKTRHKQQKVKKNRALCVRCIAGIPATLVEFSFCPDYMLVIKKTARLQGNIRQGDMMSAIDTNRVLAGTNSFGFVAKTLAILTAWNDARVTKNALNRLTDRELDDIGLCRGDIELIARR